MNFKKLEVFGFKSFADKLEIQFEPGITGIVGPNGCGKSNVADSIRWVLGEQSAKLLRGSSMRDVIFSGTELRKSLSYCEVSLHFDNSNMIFPIDFKEVVISRKLYRSGESEYAINRSPCRLKDVSDLLHDSGIGREGYSIIGQGRIDEILSAKPDDRRAIFEEAAGITKFKIRKTEAERKLARTHENLVRINDILTEIERQLTPLLKQAESARIYLDVKEKLKHFEVNTYLHQYDSASSAKAAINERLTAVNEEMEYKQGTYEKAIENYTAYMAEINSLDKKIEAFRDELLSLTVGMEKMAGEHKLLLEKLNYLREQNTRLTAETAALHEQYELAKDSLERRELTKQEKETALLTLRGEAEAVSEKYLAVVDRLTEGEGEVESTQAKIMEAMERLTEIKANLSRLTAEKAALSEKLEDLGKRSENINIKIADDEINAILIAKESEKLIAEREKLTAKSTELTAKYNEALSEGADNARRHEMLYAQYVSMTTRHKMLCDLAAEFEGYGHTVKKLLQDAKTDKGLKSLIEGVVAELLNVPEKYETAVETALGGALQNIVTATEDDAKRIIEYLKERKYGRATFLPITSAKPRSLDDGELRLISRAGCFGVAAELVKFNPKYDKVFRGLLGNTVIVDNLDTAILLARDARYSFKIVTLEGDIINPHGSISGGSKKNEVSNILGRDREIAALKSDLDKRKTEIEQLLAKKTEYENLTSDLMDEIKSVSSQVHSKDIALAAAEEKQQKLESVLAESRSDLSALSAESALISARVTEIETDIKSVDELEAVIQGGRVAAGDDMSKRQGQFEVLRRERDELHERMTEKKVAIAALDSELAALSSDIARIKNDIVEVSAKIEENNLSFEKNKATIEAADRAAKEQENRVTDSSDTERLAEIRSTLSNLDSYKQEMQSKLSEVDEQRLQLMSEIQRLTDRKYKEENLLQKVDTDIEVMQERIWEEYQLTYSTCEEYRAADYNVQEGVKEAARLKKQINALGYVNVNAIEDSRELSERYNEMNTQAADLNKAEEDLHKIIEELTAEMVEKFRTSFDQIKVNFEKIFKELFGGGRAELILLDSEDLLEAGIEIVAEPPGKKLQSISLLSGGERALTAIAILFAILRLRPMPFCVLDEIEAALDDANAERFAKYLHRFSKETQFIVITHRKPTMELADSLYGVTMEEKGVSKMVSVKLSEAIRVAEPA